MYISYCDSLTFRLKGNGISLLQTRPWGPCALRARPTPSQFQSAAGCSPGVPRTSGLVSSGKKNR